MFRIVESKTRNTGFENCSARLLEQSLTPPPKPTHRKSIKEERTIPLFQNNAPFKLTKAFARSLARTYSPTSQYNGTMYTYPGTRCDATRCPKPQPLAPSQPRNGHQIAPTLTIATHRILAHAHVHVHAVIARAGSPIRPLYRIHILSRHPIYPSNPGSTLLYLSSPVLVRVLVLAPDPK